MEFFVQNGISLLEGKQIIVDGHYPKKDKINIVKSGVIFQQYCHDGLKYDVCVSWLQKAIRRGLIDGAIYCATQMVALGRMFESHCINRLLLISSEDAATEPGIGSYAWNTYNKIQSIRDSNRNETEQLIMQFISTLCKSRKSRNMDWISHLFEEQLDHHVDRALHARVSYALLHNELCNESRNKDEVLGEQRDLMAAYRKRKDVLILLHAVQLGYYGYIVAERTLPIATDLQPWAYYENLHPKVLDDAIDKHTKDGSAILHRDDIHFLYRGSLVENWHHYPGEKEAITLLIEHCLRKLGYLQIRSDAVPRTYQKNIVQKLTDGFKTARVQDLNMACGTGKTKTCWWVAQQTLENFTTARILVVTPLLNILSQFYASWRDLFIGNKIHMSAYIMASEFAGALCSNYTTYQTITNPSEIIWDNSKCQVLFTTYASYKKATDYAFDFVIYDEAHHCKVLLPNFRYSLRMSATLGYSANVNYGYAQAIEEGAMVDYKIVLLAVDDAVAIIDRIMKECRKLIVYSSNNIKAKTLRSNLRSTDEGGAYYVDRIDCETKERDRLEMFNRFRTTDKAVILNCKILGEGVDLPECDSIFYESGCSSYATVVQSMGRCLRLHSDKGAGTIYMITDKNAKKRLDEMRKVDPYVDRKIT
jgi:superfamily II DNA or RNA helicase